MNAMCDDLDSAKLNRERIKRGETNLFYEGQAHILAQWHDGDEPPCSLIFGTLPEVNRKTLRLDRD